MTVPATIPPSSASAWPPPAPADLPLAYWMYKGCDWVMTAVILDPITLQPLDFSDGSTTLFAEVYFRGQQIPVATLSLDNGGIREFDQADGRAIFVLTSSVTKNAQADRMSPPPRYPGSLAIPAAPVPFPTRMIVFTAVPALGIGRRPAALFGIHVGDLRDENPEFFRENQVAYAFGTVTETGQVINPPIPLRTTALKRAMNAYRPGSVQDMYESGAIDIGEGSDSMLAWRDAFAPPGGPLDPLILAWLQAGGPVGPGLSAADAAARLAMLRTTAAAF